MRLSKFHTYLLLLGLFLFLILLYQSIWLISKTTTGQVLTFRHGSGEYKDVESMEISYSVNYNTYIANYLLDNTPKNAKEVQVKYILFYPEISRLNTPIGNWGLVLVVFVIYFLSLTVIFTAPDILPKDSQFEFSKRFPFIRSVIKLTQTDE